MKDFLKIWISEKRDIFLVPLEVTEKYLFFPAKTRFEVRYFIIFFVHLYVYFIIKSVLSIYFIDYCVFFDII